MLRAAHIPNCICVLRIILVAPIMWALVTFPRLDTEAQSAIRFSFGGLTTEEEIDTAIELYSKAVDKLRSLAP